MQLLATAELMRQFDNSAIHKFSIPGIVLMENAGRAFVDVLEKHVGALNGKRILIVCGKGNNGGDGFVIARHCAHRGASVHVGLVGRKSEVKGDAKTNLDSLLRMVKVPASKLLFCKRLSPGICLRFSAVDIIVDAVFGTGFTGAVKSPHKQIIEWMNEQQSFVASVDIPSGVDASTGVVENIAVNAKLTVTMGLGKIGHYVGAGREHSGLVEIVDISIPKFLFEKSKNAVGRVEMSDVKGLLPRRPLRAHKYSVGKVFVLAGSRNFPGAPIMTSQSAMRSGVGLTVLGVPVSLSTSIARRLTEVIVKQLDETPSGSISPAALPEIQKHIAWADVVALGPGLSLDQETQQVVRHVVRRSERPLVIDADALTALTGNIALLKKRRHPTILTPHVGELHRLVNIPSIDIENRRVEVARESARKLNSIVVLKGAPTVTAAPSGEVFVNSTGNPGMATGGSGDVLTGMIASLAAQGMTPVAAAFSAVYLHGIAGDLAAKMLGERSLMAMDIHEQIPAALKVVENA